MTSDIKQLKKKQLELEKLLGVDSSQVQVGKGLYAEDLENRAKASGLSVESVLEADTQLLSQPAGTKDCLKTDEILLFIKDNSQISVGGNEHLASCKYCQRMVQLTTVDHEAREQMLNQLVSPPPLGGGDLNGSSWISSTLDLIEDFGRKRQGILTAAALLLITFLCFSYSQPAQIASEDQGNSTQSSLDVDAIDEIKTQLESLTHAYSRLSKMPEEATYVVAREKISACSSRMMACTDNWSALHLIEFNISKLDNKIATDSDNAWIYLVLRGKLHLQNGKNELAQGDFDAAKARRPEIDKQRALEFLARAQEIPLSDFSQFWCNSEIEQAKPLIASVEALAFLTEETSDNGK